MPHTKSAAKRLRQNARLRLRNRATKKIIKNQIKKLRELAAKGPADELQTEFVSAVRKLDKAAARRILHPNTAARWKSHLAKLVQSKAGK